MNREQKAVAIAEIASHIDESDAVFAVDYRGISVAQAAELRARLREADAVFQVVKNSLTERAADQVGAETLKDFLTGPTALTFVRGDIATAAKAVADFGRSNQLLPFKGGLMDGAPLDVEQIRSLSRLPSREVLYGQLVGVIASPVSGLVRTLNALLGGLAVALGGVRQKKESGEVPAGEAPASEAPAEETAPAEAPADEAAVAQAPEATAAAEAPAEETAAAEAPAEEKAPAGEAAEAGEPVAEAADDQAEPAKDEPAKDNDAQADASAEVRPEDAEANPTKED